MQTLPPNVTVWKERSDANIFLEAADVFMFNSTWECNPLVLREAIGYGKSIIARNLPQYKNMFTPYIEDIEPNFIKQQLKTLLKNPAKYPIPTNNTSVHFANNHINLYKKIMKNKAQKQTSTSYQIKQNFVGQPFIEITGASKSEFRVEFWDVDVLVHSAKIKANSWVRANREYYTDWTTKVYKNDVLVYNEQLNYKDKRVYISFDSSSLGDTIAWFPYVEEFRKKHNCTVIVSTYKNFLFKDQYPELEFVEPGEIVNNLHGMYKIGWFYDENKEPELPNTIPLQKTATNILGLEYKEIKPKVSFKHERVTDQLYITIATNSTSGCKFWTRENWQEIIDYLNLRGYEVINTSLEDNPFHNCTVFKDKSLQHTISVIEGSEFFIGLSSGLSWLAWALNKEVIMISNFTNEEHEFKCHRPVVKNVCNSCWNNKNFKFDKGDWNWCPINKGTKKQFECQKSITPDMIIKEIKKLL
jgi:autotransporter strand-loop-strand O-heptosyltransferase